MLRPQIVLFGDSITQYGFDIRGWGAMLAHSYQRKADVINRGYSGYNTRWALAGIDKVFPIDEGRAPMLVTVFFGANDAALPDRSSARQHVPLDEYQANLAAIVDHLRRAGAKNLVFITPPPIFEQSRVVSNQERFGASQELELPERTNACTQKYADACLQLAGKLSVPVLDLWRHLQEHPDWQWELLSDGLHLSEKGNMVVYELLQQTINRGLPHLRPEELPLDLPLHSDIDPSNPRAAFASRA